MVLSTRCFTLLFGCLFASMLYGQNSVHTFFYGSPEKKIIMVFDAALPPDSAALVFDTYSMTTDSLVHQPKRRGNLTSRYALHELTSVEWIRYVEQIHIITFTKTDSIHKSQNNFFAQTINHSFPFKSRLNKTLVFHYGVAQMQIAERVMDWLKPYQPEYFAPDLYRDDATSLQENIFLPCLNENNCGTQYIGPWADSAPGHLRHVIHLALLGRQTREEGPMAFLYPRFSVIRIPNGFNLDSLSNGSRLNGSLRAEDYLFFQGDVPDVSKEKTADLTQWLKVWTAAQGHKAIEVKNANHNIYTKETIADIALTFKRNSYQLKDSLAIPSIIMYLKNNTNRTIMVLGLAKKQEYQKPQRPTWLEQPTDSLFVDYAKQNLDNLAGYRAMYIARKLVDNGIAPERIHLAIKNGPQAAVRFQIIP